MQHGKNVDKHAFGNDRFTYDEKNDLLLCPLGMPATKIGTKEKITKNGFTQQVTAYQVDGCSYCPLRNECHQQQQDNRIVEVNHNLRRLKQKADKRLTTKRGIEKRKQRCFDTEPVFADIKHNHQFKRFMLRGMKKVNIEFGLLAMAHNLRKKIAA